MEFELDEFVDAATKFCSFVNNITSYSEQEKLDTTSRLLANLYVHAMCLPDVEPTTREAEKTIDEVPSISLEGVDTYWEIFDPYILDEPVCGWLVDDISDIYRDVKEGLLILEGGSDEDKIDALWHWRFSFQAHWGYHLVDALRAIHWAKDHLRS